MTNVGTGMAVVGAFGLIGTATGIAGFKSFNVMNSNSKVLPPVKTGS